MSLFLPLSKSNENMSQVRVREKEYVFVSLPHSDPFTGLQVSLEIKVRFFNPGWWL